ncbi:hypothetical protein HKBW3S03_01430 [Candidatus Hakubella thermalkaliphila]|uniref:Polymerase beta nucleotidyltransferase domain-containing protein n=1 Tax=Candidatus Hakubella thermalkaliphila TaxID=2754717 RepID=A0A6V8NN62_9ACTN|nr:hypothetical protein [Candidatus Hakubella thermalkaliphila]GFP19926.1 hypothetical protein HKBW3S03_01430 [Candidatus Hakubella thermalkaliphila]GFP23930.1 hypothetical protein HKBW3S09_01396 [Candidatus Hakubella thermalkaliphila]GFP31238.1 hypothetical protein HKBW3S34_02157 [Candidatus Hakubella thermalkaliphila]GFP40393.1 hypothetical protein HKBW3S47_02089 [Candidatus Hakubella thermalkaliphila]
MGLKTFDISLWEKAIEDEYKKREKERLKILQKSVKTLKTYFKGKGVRRVFLAGSILEEGRFYPFSDIDVVVDGLIEGYFKTLSELEELLERSVDLIELEECKFKDCIEKKGLKII